MSGPPPSPTSGPAPQVESDTLGSELTSPTMKHLNVATASTSAAFTDGDPSTASNLNTANSVANPSGSAANSSSTIPDADFVNSTRTELPFSDSDLTAEVVNGTTEAPVFYKDYSSDANDTYNPFLANDYDYYYFNPDVEREPYDYTQVDQDAKRDEALALWKNVDIPPAVNYADFTPRDLDPYFLVLPPVLCLAFLLLVFVPCFVLKLRDDIREISGKDRKYGSKRYGKQKKITHESFQVIDPEWQLASGGKDASGNALRDIQYVKPGASGTNSTSDRAVSAAAHGKANPAYVEENEVCTQQPKTSSRSDPPVDYSEEEVTSASGNDRVESDETQSDGNVESVGGPGKDVPHGSDGNKGTGDNVTSSSYPKFTGWNKDLYSNEAGFGPPAKVASGAPAEASGDKTWGMY